MCCSFEAMYDILTMLSYSLGGDDRCCVCWGGCRNCHCCRCCCRRSGNACILISVGVSLVWLTYWIRSWNLWIAWMKNIRKSKWTIWWWIICDNDRWSANTSWIKYGWYFVISCHFAKRNDVLEQILWISYGISFAAGHKHGLFSFRMKHHVQRKSNRNLI